MYYALCTEHYALQVHAYIIGGVCGVISGMNARTSEFHQVMDIRNIFLHDRTIASANPELCMRLCKFYRYRHRHGSSVSEELLRLLRLGLFLGSQSQKIVA